MKRAALQTFGNLRHAALFLCALLFLLAPATHAAPTLTSKTANVFYVDFSKNLRCMYVAYEVTNDAVARPSVWVTIGGFTGGALRMAVNGALTAPNAVSLGSMAPGEKKLACFYLEATTRTLVDQGFTLTVLDNIPGLGATLLSQTYPSAFLAVGDDPTGAQDTIAANANKVNTTVTTPNPPTVGGLVTITVSGNTGTMGGAGVLAFSPATFTNWRADALQLVDTTITLSGGNTGTITNTLLVPPPASSSNTAYTAVYNFRIVNLTGISTPVSPVGYISSGTQVKHTDTGDFANLQPVLPPSNTTSISKSVSPIALPVGGTATYTVRITNTGPYEVTLDRVVDVLPSSPANATYVAGSSSLNGVAIPNPNITGQTLTWSRPFVIPAGSFRELVYSTTIPNIGGAFVNRVTGYVSTTRIDTTADTSDDAPAQASVAVPSADVVVTKSGPASAFVGNTFTYTVNYQNNGPTLAQNVVIQDTLPSQVTFVSATGGGTHAGGVVTWPTMATLANGATGSFTVTVRATTAGTAVNVASSTSATYDPTPANNDGTAAASRVSTTLTISSDVVTTKSGPATGQVGQPITYTLTATNNGPSSASGVIVRDTLPAGLTYGSSTGGGTHAAGVVTWPTVATLASGASVSYTVTVTAAAEGSYTDVASSTSTSSDPTPANNNGTAAASRVTTVVANGFPLSGYVYEDTNLNVQKDSTEVGTGLTLFVKVLSAATPAGPASAAASVDPATGAYSFATVPTGTYSLILDDNSTLSDVTPVQPSGWTGTESRGGIRSPVAVASVAVSNQNFGLAHALPIQGRAFIDTGSGGGVANDGALNGSETGLAGAGIKLTDASGATTYSTVVSDASGAFTLFIPNTLATGTSLRIVETNPAGYLSTGANVGTTGGTYTRATDTIAFSLTAGTSYIGLFFAEVPVNTLAPDGQQSGLPGTVIFYPHTFVAGSAGQVTFSAVNAPTPTVAGWTNTIIRDLDADGRLDDGEPAITGPINVTAGQSISLLVKVFIPIAAPLGAKDSLTLSAVYSYIGASPALSSTATRKDVTTVGNPDAAGLALVKAVNKATALPGETITYTITYTNNSSEALNNVIIYDATPAFSRYSSASNGALPTGLTGVTLTAPAVGATGAIRWTFTGTLSPGGTGTVTFSVTIDQ